MTTSHFDQIDVDSLREIGGVKWSMFPEHLGAFVAEMDFGTAAPITQAMHSTVDLGLHGYLPPKVGERMSRACGDWMRDKYGWDVPPERIRPIPDVIKALELSIEYFSVPGSPVILPTPAYMPFVSVPPTMGREVIQVPMVRVDGRAVYDLEALQAAFDAGGNLLILCNPHNPLGRVMERHEMEQIAEAVERNGGRVFSDEIHAPLVYPGSTHLPYASVSPEAAGHTITATSASKAWNLPGVKCAQLILSNDDDAEVWARVGMLPEHGAANLGVIANTAAYTSGGKWLESVLDYLDGNRALLASLLDEHLPMVGYTPPEGTYLAWLDFRETGIGDTPAEFLRERAGVALTEGGMCGEVGKGFARLNFATPRPILTRMVTQIADAVMEARV